MMKTMVIALLAAGVMMVRSCGDDRGEARSFDTDTQFEDYDDDQPLALSGKTTRSVCPVEGPVNTLSVGAFFKVVLSDTVPGLVLYADSALVPYVNYSFNDKGRLRVSVERHNLSALPEMTLFVPYTDRLTIFNLSGMSHLKSELPLKGRKLDFDLKGGASVEAEVQAESLEVELGGISSATFSGRADRLKAEAAGSSELHMASATVQQADLELGGMSSAELACRERLEAELSGSSSLRVGPGSVRQAELELGGMSSAELTCQQHLEAELSGTSTLTYGGPCTTVIEQSGLSTVTRLP